MTTNGEAGGPAGAGTVIEQMVAGAPAVKERFSAPDWHAATLLPLQLFNFMFLRLLREQPHLISVDLVRRFTDALVKKTVVPDPVFVAVMVDVDPDEWPQMVSEAISNDVLTVVDELETTGDMLSRVLSRKERNSFLGAVLTFVVQEFASADEAGSVTTMRAMEDLTKVLGIDLEAAVRALRKSSRDVGVF